MTFKHRLLTVPATKWVVQQVIAFDWYDGPRCGLCQLSSPEAEFWFQCVEEKHNAEGLDLRLCTVARLPRGTMDYVLRSLSDLGPASSPIWAPVWRFSNMDQERDAERMVSRIRNTAEDTDLLICASSFRAILRCWARSEATRKLSDLLNEVPFEE